jgi:chromosome segregation ATPase
VTQVRSYPEDRSKIELDLRTARRELQDSQREIRSIQRVLEELNNEARKEGCGR